MLKSLVFIEILVLVGSAIFYYALNRTARREIGTFPGIIFGSMAAIAFLSPAILITHIAIGLLPIMLARTRLKVGIMMAAGFIALPAFHINLTLGGAYLFPWSLQSSLGIGCFIALLIAPGKLAKTSVETDLAMVILISVLVVIDARAGAAVGYLRQLAMYVFVYGLPVFVITRSARDAAERRMLLTALAGAGVILSVIVLYEARATWPLYASLAQHYQFDGHGIVVKWRGGMMRAYGPLSEATSMGFVLVICFAAAFSARRSFKTDTAYVAVVALVAAATLAPQSRGGLIGLAVAFIISSFYRRGVSSLGQIVGAGTLLIGAYVGSIILGSQLKTSLTEANTGDYRSQLLTRGMEEFWKNPVFGDSPPNVIGRMQDMVQGEGIVDFVNTYLYFALFAGGIGLVLFCVSFIIPMARLAGIRSRLPPLSDERDVAGFCFALLCSAAVMLAFTSFLERPSMYLLVAASMAMMIEIPRRVVRKSDTARPVSAGAAPQVA